MGQERLYEFAKFGSLVEPQNLSAATLYNGVAATVASGYGLDTMGYDGITIFLNTGTFSGDGTLAVSVYAGATDDSTACSLISGAAFESVSTANDQTLYKGYVKVHAQARYLFVKTVKGGTGDALASIEYGMDRGQKHPELANSSLAFDVDGSV